MKLSIIICTYNREKYIAETINSVLHATNQNFHSEILIIDNNSTDNTRTLLEHYTGNSQIKIFSEENQGLSYARNRGMKEASGDILVFLDDDIHMPDNYFKILNTLFENRDNHIIGGKVLPYNETIPKWLPSSYYFLASIFDLGDQELKVRKLMGANFAMRKEVAAKVGNYNTDLGRKGNLLMAGEEVDYLNRASLIGYTIKYIPGLLIYHKINSKLNRNYIYEYSYRNGISERLMHKGFKKKIMIIKSFMAILYYYVIGKHLTEGKFKTYAMIIHKYAKGYLS